MVVLPLLILSSGSFLSVDVTVAVLLVVVGAVDEIGAGVGAAILTLREGAVEEEDLGALESPSVPLFVSFFSSALSVPEGLSIFASLVGSVAAVEAGTTFPSAIAKRYFTSSISSKKVSSKLDNSAFNASLTFMVSFSFVSKANSRSAAAVEDVSVGNAESVVLLVVLVTGARYGVAVILPIVMGIAIGPLGPIVIVTGIGTIKFMVDEEDVEPRGFVVAVGAVEEEDVLVTGAGMEEDGTMDSVGGTPLTFGEVFTVDTFVAVFGTVVATWVVLGVGITKPVDVVVGTVAVEGVVLVLLLGRLF